MKFNYQFFIFFLLGINIYSQNIENVLFTINNEPTTEQEFVKAYQKNLKIVTDEKKEKLNDFLQLYINFKLKVKEAKELKLDTLQSFKTELQQYKIDLSLPYLKDTLITNNLVKEAYNRLQEEVDVSHILIFLKPDANPKDTLAAYNKLLEARDLILQDENFAEVAKKYSQDPTAKQNGGNIGYFTALQLVYPFENIAYTTPINKISMPFRTKFGYHILKVNDIRPAKGEVEVAHIMIKNNALAKQKIDSIYNLLINKNANFSELAKKLSDDKASAAKGGILPKFGTGKMIQEFADVAFSLTKENEISKPFQSRYGWHIIKLIKKYPLQSFDEMKHNLTKQVENDSRSNIIDKFLIDKLLKSYNVVVNNSALEEFSSEDWKKYPQKFNEKLFSIEQKNYSQQNFIEYLKNQHNTNSITTEFLNFRNQELIQYYKDNLQFINANFAASYNEFRDGLLLFNLLEKEVWNKSKDSVGLHEFYNLNKNSKLKSIGIDKNRGEVIAEYQNYLENKLVTELRKKLIVKINKKELNSVKKLLN